ncbi:MAG: hypothetical protein KDG50_15280 [Chromatiales bacterium]|nr:hypothetical protein [Chromatiales bacterium]
MKAIVPISAVLILLAGTAAAGSLTPCCQRPKLAAVELTEALPVAVDQARVFLQHGRIVEKQRRDLYAPTCAFEVDALSDGSKRIEAQSFRVRRVQDLIDAVVHRGADDGGGRFVRVGMDDASPSDLFLGYHFWFETPQRGDVMRMSCYGAYAAPQDARPPTLAEIREALGGFARVDVAG